MPWSRVHKYSRELVSWLTDTGRKKIFEDNAKKVYPRLVQHL